MVASTLTGMIDCPECGQVHDNPQLWCEDENNLAGAHVVCPVTGKSFPLSARQYGTEVEEVTDETRFQLEEEAPEETINRFGEWIYSPQFEAIINRALVITQGRQLKEIFVALFGKTSLDTAEMLTALRRVIERRLGEAS